MNPGVALKCGLVLWLAVFFLTSCDQGPYASLESLQGAVGSDGLESTDGNDSPENPDGDEGMWDWFRPRATCPETNCYPPYYTCSGGIATVVRGFCLDLARMPDDIPTVTDQNAQEMPEVWNSWAVPYCTPAPCYLEGGTLNKPCIGQLELNYINADRIADELADTDGFSCPVDLDEHERQLACYPYTSIEPVAAYRVFDYVVKKACAIAGGHPLTCQEHVALLCAKFFTGLPTTLENCLKVGKTACLACSQYQPLQVLP